MDISELKKDGKWYRGPKKGWEKDKYGFDPWGLSDLIYNNLRKIIEDGDKSVWAYKVFDQCTVLLINGKRWPDDLNPPKIYTDSKKYRRQKSITRDPWVLYYAACIHLNKREFIALKPQWRLYRPNLWELRKALLGKKNSYRLWRLMNNFIAKFFPRKDFVVILEKYRNWSYDRKPI